MSFPDGSAVKNPHADAGDTGATSSIPGSGKSPRGENGKPLKEKMATHSYLENPKQSGAWWVTVYRVSKNWRQLSN